MTDTPAPPSLKIAVAGGSGRVGALLVRHVIAADDLEFAAASVASGAPECGQDIGIVLGTPALNINFTDQAADMFDGRADCVIDFTAPDASCTHATLAAENNTPLIIGTTGLSETQEQELRKAAEKTVIVYAANMSVGVNLLAALVQKAAKALDPAWDIEIAETHHKHKIDAPSGTALMLGKAARKGRGDESRFVTDRIGKRQQGDIGFAVQRGGDIVGAHDVSFYSEGEHIRLSHTATDRALFARGALHAARWVHTQKPENGLYSMQDILGLSG